MQMYAEIGIAAMQAESQQAEPSPEGVQVNMPSQRREQDPSFEILAEMEVDDIPDHYQCDEAAHILRWVKTIASSDAPATWVSFHQLLIDYQAFSHRLGPRFLEKKWRPADFKPDLLYQHKKHAVWFSQYLTNLCSHMHLPLDLEQRRPASHLIAFWTGCIRVKLSVQRLHQIDHHFRKFLHVSVVRQIGRDLANIQPGFVV